MGSAVGRRGARGAPLGTDCLGHNAVLHTIGERPSPRRAGLSASAKAQKAVAGFDRVAAEAPARAEIDGDHVTLTCPKVPHPQFVRYA